MVRNTHRLFSTVDKKEVEKFNKTKDWWNPNGSMKPLHAYNRKRVDFLRKLLLSKNTVTEPYFFLENKSVLDVGCGGGLLVESMAAFGGKVIGVDANPNSIEMAEDHLKRYSPHLLPSIQYIHTSLEDHQKQSSDKFDLVTSMEVIEHVSDTNTFIASLAQATKENGFVVLSSLNKGVLSYLFNIVGAEYLLRLLPIGTHDYDKFITPQEITDIALRNNLELIKLDYNMYDPLTNEFYRDTIFETNYLIAFRKKAE